MQEEQKLSAGHDIYVFCDDAGASVVYPKIAIVSRGSGAIRCRNLTDQDVTLTFEEGVLADGPVAELPARAKNVRLPLDETADGIYDYTATIGDAEIDPKIIVDP